MAERDVSFRMAIGTLNGFALIIQEVGGEKKCHIHTHTTVGTLLAVVPG